MKYRKIARCGFEVSEIGLGCEHLENMERAGVEEVLRTAVEGGVNILDVFMPGPEVRSRIGDVIRPFRQELHLQGHIGAVMENGQYKRTRAVPQCDEYVRDFLTRFHTDTIDIGMIHFVDDLDDWQAIQSQGLLEYALGLKQKGVIRALGMSSHEPRTALAAVQSGALMVGTGITPSVPSASSG